MQKHHSPAAQEAKTLHTGHLIPKVLKPRHAEDVTIRCQKAAAGARATTVLKQCNGLDYAPRDLMRRTNVAWYVSAWLYVALVDHMVQTSRRKLPKQVVGSVAWYLY
jgi:hypothetical protein